MVDIKHFLFNLSCVSQLFCLLTQRERGCTYLLDIYQAPKKFKSN